MKIQLKHWIVEDLKFKIDNKKSRKGAFELGYGAHFPESNREFHIPFKISIKDADFIISSTVVYVFEVDKEIDEEFKNSPFVSINAPAIAFPYLRAFLSNFTLQAGFQPIVLPSINFVEFSQKNKKV